MAKRFEFHWREHRGVSFRETEESAPRLARTVPAEVASARLHASSEGSVIEGPPESGAATPRRSVETTDETEPSINVERGFTIREYGATGDVGEEGDAYGQIRTSYGGQFGTDEGWSGDVDRGISVHPLRVGAAPWEHTYFEMSDERSDETLASNVRDLLQEGWVNAAGIHFFVRSGCVHLHGLVERRQERQLLHELIGALPGVRGIEDSLRVAAPGEPHGLPSSDPAR